jgi:serine phosphatase RsbU (regulator of sigma subunit)
VTRSWSCILDDIVLGSGDILLLYTDGVTEARRGGEMFGEQRLLDWLTQHGAMDLDYLPSALLTSVLDFSDGILQDDVAILAVAPDVGGDNVPPGGAGDGAEPGAAGSG